MIKDIKYSGYSTVPSDYECPDGDLALALNIIPENGSLSGLRTPETRFSVPPHYRLFIHETTVSGNYLAYSAEGKWLKWIGTLADGKFTKEITVDIPDLGTVVSISAVGLIVIIATSANIFYIRFDASENTYVFLGSSILLPRIAFGLSNTFESSLASAVPISVDKHTVDQAGDDTSGSQVVQIINFNQNSCIPTANSNMTRTYTYGMFQLPYPPDYDMTDESTPIPYLKGDTISFKWRIEESVNVLILDLTVFGLEVESGKYVEILRFGGKKGGIRSIVLENDCSALVFQISATVAHYESSFSVKSRLIVAKGANLTPDTDDNVEYTINYNSDNFTAIKAVMNKFIADKATAANKFIYPFFVRYAVRLFDGQYAAISAPVLMVPNSGFAPLVGYQDLKDDSSDLYVAAMCSTLKYRVDSSFTDNWKDIVAGIDIFISAPVWTYNQGEEFDKTKNLFSFSKNPVSLSFDASVPGVVSLAEQARRILHVDSFVLVSPRPHDDIVKDIESSYLCYKVASLDFDKILVSPDFIDVRLEKDCLSALVARTPLDTSEMPLAYSGFVDAQLFSYNSRLIMAPRAVIPHSPAPLEICNAVSADSIKDCVCYVSVWLKTSDGVRIVRSDFDNTSIPDVSLWFFYPDSRAYKAQFSFIRSDGTLSSISIDLHPHDYLNGSFAFLGELNGSFPTDKVTQIPPDGQSSSVNVPGSIYYSEASDPFIFTARNFTNIQNAEIRAVSSAARALSQGQFGQFPLYALTSQGVWALEVNSSGGFSACQPITRDVCLSADSVVQLDSAVLFASARGLMLLSGSQTQCISDLINSDTPFDVTSLPAFESLHHMMGHITDLCVPTIAFSQFLSNCRMIYDYTHQRVFIFSHLVTYAYVYSLNSKAWAMTYSNFRFPLNSYPETLVLNSAGELLDFSASPSSDNNPSVNCLLVTRPLKLEIPDILKTIDTVIQRGNFCKGHVQSVLYGSRDLSNWHLVWSSCDHYLRGFRGTPYKYYRIALVCNLRPDESIFGASLQFTPRQTNQPR